MYDLSSFSNGTFRISFHSITSDDYTVSIDCPDGIFAGSPFSFTVLPGKSTSFTRYKQR